MSTPAGFMIKNSFASNGTTGEGRPNRMTTLDRERLVESGEVLREDPDTAAHRLHPDLRFRAASGPRENGLVDSHGENCRSSLTQLGVDWQVRPDILGAFFSENLNFGHRQFLVTKIKEAAADGDQDTPRGRPGAEGIGDSLAA
jgi:hypothetical protein